MKKRMTLLLCGVLLLAISSSASAVIALWHEAYLPTIDEKTVISMTRESSSYTYASNQVKDSDITCVGWLQAQTNGSWPAVLNGISAFQTICGYFDAN